ncbi:MAG: four helix bundle protein [Bacteroidetes bacterium]|nr:four helix bundle protein [Bacteroidota bacterium]
MKNKLEVWAVAHELTLLVYDLTKDFPKSEEFGITSQLRRGASSIPANIIEGQARQYKKEFVQFLYVSRGSAEETHYHAFLAKELGYLNESDYEKVDRLCIRVKMMLNKLINSIK